jgi:deoxyribodipyrimidine photo-lyase
MKTILYWFKHDLRIHDMPGISAIHEGDYLVPVYIFDPRHSEILDYGFPKMSARRKFFLCESVLALQKKLRSLNSDLLILEGKPEEIIPMLVQECDIDLIHTEKEIAHEEVSLIERIKKQIVIPLREFESRTIFHESELPWKIEQLPEVFTAFRKGIEKSLGYSVTPITGFALPPLPKIPHLDASLFWNEYVISQENHPKAAIKAIGGEDAGLSRLHDYTFGNHGIATYKQTRNGLIGEAYSSKLSLWLSVGALSTKKIIDTVNAYEAEFGANDSTYWMKFELLWREFFHWTLKKHGNAFFQAGGIRGIERTLTWNADVFDRWRYGETKDSFVNANMKELHITGFMSNRGRQNVASYLIHELQQDWRIGAAWFESRLLDYDVASNWGNWIYLAGVGNDPRQDRIFNTRKQAEMYDPHGEYQVLWANEKLAKNDY